MNFSFGIVTAGNNDDMLNQIIDSIEKMCIPNYEIIIVGSCKITRKRCKVVDFNESIKQMWITRKKNIITTEAIYENIVFSHDYISFDENWYKEFLTYGDKFKVCSSRILNSNNERFRDWTLWPDDLPPQFNFLSKREYILPYEIKHLSKYMYISGAYWIAKKEVMLEFSLNEKLSWGESEDVEWSKRVVEKYNFEINEKSIVKFLKMKKRSFNEIKDKNKIERLKEIQ